MYVKNMVKVYPNKLKIFEYKKGYHKRNPGDTPIDDWYDVSQYHQKVVYDIFHEEPPKEFISPNFIQVPMPHARSHTAFLRTLDARTGINSQNELQALIMRNMLARKSLLRSKANLFDYIQCNTFDMFITFSFSKDRYDIQKCKTRMMQWIDNQAKLQKKKHNSKFEYILVMEYHKDGKAIHFHGLFNNYKGAFTKSLNPHTNKPVYQRGKLVHNLKSYRHGFTNMTYIKNQEATGRYVTKYVTKDLIEIPGQKRYWASKGLKKPDKLYNEDVSTIEKELQFDGNHYTISTSRDKLPQ